jgi:hypothetical protein
MVSELDRSNTSRPAIFLKTYGEKRLNAHIRTIVVLTCGKLTVFKLRNYDKNVWCDFWKCFELFCCLWKLFCY